MAYVLVGFEWHRLYLRDLDRVYICLLNHWYTFVVTYLTNHYSFCYPDNRYPVLDVCCNTCYPFCVLCLFLSLSLTPHFNTIITQSAAQEPNCYVKYVILWYFKWQFYDDAVNVDSSIFICGFLCCETKWKNEKKKKKKLKFPFWNYFQICICHWKM